ncbi:conserved hypothetical protein-like protein [Zymomonas mobilis subsp. pomaceae ATCC 29192]|uniref:Ancillary SecYEG translocon subunit/Cell division coordinator CpoB TPR domain-containing protein n=1 Tax=Zymomonas mobilis subsp. pomaceae (strain ATCC 29192 / DSM 22645 / JCM 10191 / CCUG 17912 / NBRC 13757 / NCIMB 11200 / NRRL B-4491 / Barker I) TaxID=579138 RepID=F8ES88_ZYMMT|nr:conserved hypothetical protein-like protein [Zymomonas mobilis subsp. pomaceae ATCC 29192]
MADLPHNSTDNKNALHAVSEQPHLEKAKCFCETHRRCIVGIVCLVVAILLVSGIGCWSYHRHKQAEIEKRGEALTNILAPIAQGGQVKDMAALDKLIASGDPIYASLGRFLKAGSLADKGDVKGASALYQTIIKDQAAGDILQAVATLHLSAIELDTLPPADVIKRLQPLMLPGSRWLGTAGEIQAAAYLKDNKPDQAVKVYQRIIAEPSVPEDIRERAKSLANSYADIVPAKAKQANSAPVTPAPAKK